ncbi:MAG: hypothetical protein DMD91_07640 [Candidatus Rokuibacteriota bacterium]|nr:MAG: hypothetical protein DMD91_07640 [Candidatus Rokubacteria bacterium]
MRLDGRARRRQEGRRAAPARSRAARRRQDVRRRARPAQGSPAALLPPRPGKVTGDDGLLLFTWRPPKAGSLFFCRHLPVRAGARVLEIGSGLGLAAVLAARAGAHVVATDIVPDAVEAIRGNAALNGVSVDVRLGDCYAPVRGERFDLICSNPPQMPTPPGRERADAAAAADNGGVDGWQILDRIIDGAPEHVAPGGRLVSAARRHSPSWRRAGSRPPCWPARFSRFRVSATSGSTTCAASTARERSLETCRRASSASSSRGLACDTAVDRQRR